VATFLQNSLGADVLSLSNNWNLFTTPAGPVFLRQAEGCPIAEPRRSGSNLPAGLKSANVEPNDHRGSDCLGCRPVIKHAKRAVESSK
jgi:hypothetical protein